MMPLRTLWRKREVSLHCMRGCVTFSTMLQKAATIGIDFGCKNSRVAIIESLLPRVVGNETGNFTPSYVTLTEMESRTPYRWCMQHLDRVGKCVVAGQVAKYRMLRQPSDVVYNIKKLIGKQIDDSQIQEMRDRVHFKIVEGPKGEAWVEIHGMNFSPVEISSAIFEKLKDTVLMYQFYHKLQVVISVPAFFNEQQREDIKLAGNKAGLDVLEVIDEPTAAVVSCMGAEDHTGILVVFGMGAGSYSISILHVPSTELKDIKVKAQSGDPLLGGDQFDSMLVDHFVSKINELHSINIRGDKYATVILAEKMEQVKMDLSDQLEVTVSIPFFTATAEGPVHLNITISRTEFENLVDDLIGQIKKKCQNVLKEANITEADIDEIVLFGGMTRMPKIQGTICEVFGKHQKISRVNPEEAVAIGSAIQAALFVEESQEMCGDMIPLSIGIESVNGTFVRVIPRNTTLPAKRTITIPAWCAEGECLRIRIFLGEHTAGHYNLPLGEVQLINSRSSFQGSVNFELTFEVDKDYVVKVSATDADCPSEGAGDMGKVFKTLTIDRNVLCKHHVDKVIRDALLNRPMPVTEVSDPIKMSARYIMNTLNDALLSRSHELPEDLYENAKNELTELQGSLDSDDVELKDILSAESMVARVLNWTPSESIQSNGSDSEN